MFILIILGSNLNTH